MQPIGSMFRRTNHHVARQRELFALRTRKAGSTFASETRNASRELAHAVRAEADVWGKYVRDGAATLGGSIAPVSLERKLLVRVAHALRSLDLRLRRRIEALDGHGKRVRSPSKAKRRSANGVARPVTRRDASSSARARAS